MIVIDRAAGRSVEHHRVTIFITLRVDDESLRMLVEPLEIGLITTVKDSDDL
jgi:hypothetical protein